MNSVVILSAVLLALIATTNAVTCRPVTCMIVCPFGLAVDAEGCPHCSCRTTPNVCHEQIFGYNCGTVDHRDCPSSHECQFSLSGLTGQCCLKSASSTTGSPKSTTDSPKSTTATPKSTTATPKPTTRQTATSTSTARVTPVSTTRRAVSRVQRSAGTRRTTRRPSTSTR